jgi:threonine aldolase
MPENNLLLQAFKQTTYKLAGNGPRNIQVMKDALAGIDGQQASDIYGKGEVIEEFEAQMAAYLGKEDAVFFPSGTMAQQIALRIWCDRRGLRKVAYHPLCHLEIHEEDGLKVLHQIEPILLADKDRVIDLHDVQAIQEEISCLLLELPQREIGGQLPDYETLVAISNHCREQGIKLHLDGARLFEILPYYKKTASEICQLFDSVYVSFYKGIGGVAGAILAGDKDLTDEAVVWKRRHGGDLISLYPYILTARYYFEKRVGRMERYFEEANELAGRFNQCHHVSTLPKIPVSNMFHVHIDLPKPVVEKVLLDIHGQTDVGFTGYLNEVSETRCSFEMNLGDEYERISEERLNHAFELLSSKLLASVETI